MRRLFLFHTILGFVILAACSPGHPRTAMTVTATSETTPNAPATVPATPASTAPTTTGPTAVSSPQPTDAGTPNPPALGAVYANITNDPQGGIELVTVSANGLQPVISLIQKGAFIARISDDGRWVAAVMDGGQTVHIQAVESGNVYGLAQPDKWSVSSLGFSPDNSKLAYVSLGQLEGRTGTMDWRLVVVDLKDGQEAVLETRYVGESQKNLPGWVLGWQADGRHILLDRFVPYSEGGNQGLISVDLGSAQAGVKLPLPEPRQLLGGEYRVPQLSPDYTRVAYLTATPGYKPENFEMAGPGVIPLNQAKVLDLTSGTTTELLTISDGRALAYLLAWHPSSNRLLVAVGRYETDANGVSMLRNLTLYARGLQGQTAGSEQPLVTLSATENASGIAWCSDAGVYLAGNELQGKPGTGLWFLPLGGGSPTVLHNGAPQIQLLQCRAQ